MPLCFVVEARSHGAFTQPPPALLYIRAVVESLKKSLRSSLAVHERAVGFGEGACGQHKLGRFCSGVDKMIEHNQMPDAAQQRCHLACRRTTEQVVLKDNQRARRFALDRLECLGESARLHQRQAKAIALWRGETEICRATCLAQSPCNLSRCFDDALAAAACTGNDQADACAPSKAAEISAIIVSHSGESPVTSGAVASIACATAKPSRARSSGAAR